MEILPYDRLSALNYARRWAFSRNPEYIDFSDLGGDCTSFVSQCIYAGSNVMNYEPLFGWYYISSYDRAPSWSDVEFFYDFFTSNEGVGPFGADVPENAAEPGDVVQFAALGSARFTHTLLITRVVFYPRHILFVSAHSDDAYMRPLSTYRYGNIRFLHIEGVRR